MNYVNKFDRNVNNKIQSPEKLFEKGVGELKKTKLDKKIAVTYKCPSCGRKKVVRFDETPVPSSYGFCPRCSDFKPMYTETMCNQIHKSLTEYAREIANKNKKENAND